MHTGGMDIAEPAARRRVAAAIKDRREAKRLRQEDVSAAGGPSKAVMFQLENAAEKGYSDATIGKLEDALQWRRGSVAAIVAGGDPTPLDEPAPQPPTRSPDESGTYTVITAGGLTIRIAPAPGARLQDVIARQSEIAEIVAKRLAELDAEQD